MTRPNGVTTTWSYEQYRDLVTQVQNGTVSTYGYVNDAIGRRTSMSRSGSAYATSDVISYTYNDRSELTGAVSNVDTTYSYSYVYDPIGNRVTASETGVPWTYTTNNLNQYTSATENSSQLSFAYDLDGSMTYRPVDATSGWTQVWNGENRMVETYKGTDRLTFKYDYMGRRVEKCVYSGNTLASRTLFVYDGFKCVEELDGLNSNAVLMRHTWQTFDVGLDVILATTDANGASYFLHDVNKNVMQKTDVNGALQEVYTYASFGENTGMSVATIGFSSEAFVPQIFLAYYNYRYYMPALGKWCNRDPLGEKNMLTLYAMTKNDSINHFDNLGLTCCNGKQLKSNECCFKNQVHIRSFGISSDINGQCCVRLTTICLTRSYLHLNIEIAGISYSYGMKSNWGMLVFPQFWNSAKVYQSPSGNTKIKCFKVTLPVASTLIQEMNKLVEGDTSYQGSYGLISWGEHGSNCRSFSQTFYNEFKRFEYNGDYPECK